MTKKNAIYQCQVCGNMVEIVEEGIGQLVCCGKPMDLVKENTIDASKEKHVPIISKQDINTYVVNVGSTAHPMSEEHWIKWIELQVGKSIIKKQLLPNDKPEATFVVEQNVNTQNDEVLVKARTFCNLHGLWQND